jgi:hypothetical protein
MKKIIIFTILSVVLGITSCDFSREQQKSDSGITKATVKVETGIDGLTTEQRNISKRLERDNQPGSIKHLYIVSAYSGDVLQYSTVDGKVTSGNKRLSPKTVKGDSYNSANPQSNWVTIGVNNFVTDEVLDDGGTYGESGNYLYWFDAQGNYQQYYPSGGTYLHISDRPLRIKKSTITLELEDLKASK